MPISSMRFNGASGRDIHLLRGDLAHNTSRPLLDFALMFTEILPAGPVEISAPAYFQKHRTNVDVVVECLPTFRHIDDHVSANLENFGIHVNRATGTVLVDPGPIAKPFPSNFLIQVNARHLNVTPAPAAVPPIFLRVHVHDGVDRIWLTPERLTVRRNTPGSAEATSYRFTVRARFTDGTVGDVTLHHGVTWTPTPKHFQPGPFTQPELREEPGFIQLPANFMGPETTVTATWQAGGGAHSATARFTVAPPWANEAPATLPTIELVSGTPAVWSGSSPERSPNVLMMGAGFATVPELGVFRDTVASISSALRTDRMTQPYNLLANSMNIWRVAFPAANPGVSVRGAVHVTLRTSTAPDGTLRNNEYAVLIPQPKPHPGGSARWKLEHLIFAVGLPLPSYPAELRGPLGLLTGVRAFWTATARAESITSLLNLTAADLIKLADKWLALSEARFIDEVDSFPAIAVGAPPDANHTRRGNEFSFHDDRGDERELPAHFAALSSSGGVVVTGGRLGHLWAGTNAAFTFDNRSLVVILVAGRGGALLIPERGVIAPIETGLLWPIAPVSTGQLKHQPLDPLVAPTLVSFPEFSRLVAHELSHGFGLRDEYAETPQPFTDPENTLTSFPNVTSLAGVANGGRVQSAMIKWNWDRIQRAAVLSGPVTPGGGTFKIPVVPGQQLVFKQGETVRLRLRVPGRPLARAIDTLVTFSELDLKIVSLLGDAITVTSASAQPRDLSPFGRGSIVFAPVRADPANPVSLFLKMIAPNIAAKMDASGDPLTGPAASCNPLAESLIGTADQIPILERSLLPLLFSYRSTPEVVGLYSGGMTLACGVFHPTGTCMMRNHHPAVNRFCPVCQYALVDLIDPTKHAEVDADYAWIYPD
jgi:hypothetical protein